METHIVRQPILDIDQKVVAYEIVYSQDASTLYNKRDAHVANTIISFFSDLSADDFLAGKDCFLTFTPNLLFRDIPKVFDSKKLVIQIEENILINPEAKKLVSGYKKDGYRVAIIGFDFNRQFLNILSEIDIIKVDFSDISSGSIDVLCKLAKSFSKQIAAYNVNSPEAKELAINYSCDFIQGKNVSGMMSTKVHKMEHLKSNFFRLMGAINKETPDFDEIAQIISLDVTLAFSLLTLVNSSYFALPNRVKDVKQALTILGLEQLRQWLFLLSFSGDGGMADELIKISFLRAVFCQEVSRFIPEFPISHQEAYLLGMFSTLGLLLEVPIHSAIAQLPLSEELKNGLMGESGKCGQLLNLSIAYEKGAWRQVSNLASELMLGEDVIKAKYLEAVEYVNGIWSELTM